MASTLFTSGTVVASAWLNDADTATYNRLTSVAGTNAITATGPSSLSSIAAGDRFLFAPAVSNTGAVTINISGLGVQPITKYGATNLVAGDLVAGTIALIVYDGSVFQLVNPSIVDVAHGGTGATTGAQALINLGAVGRLIGVQTFTANATYTPTSGTNSVVVELQAGGGGGGGSQVTAAGQVAIGAGGGGGGAGRHRMTAGFSGAAVVVGAGGTGAAGANGNAGSASSFAGIAVGGGFGGQAGAPGATGSSTAGAGGGSAACNIVNFIGGSGETGVATFASGFVDGTYGGASAFGRGANNSICGLGNNANGNAGVAYGGGGSGGVGGASQAATSGGAGAAGIVIVYEYS
jgi:hypothetical protein